jgi:NADPH:quinone reductase-like Zn-dependent oxidoreductase
MRALVMEGFGEPAQARIGDLPKPEIGPDEVLVRIVAASLNPVDWKEMAGMLAAFYPPYPARWAPGFDGAGVVEAVGGEVSDLAPGDRVIVRPDRIHGGGVLAEYARAPQAYVAKAPARLGFAQAACLATGPRTAWQAFFRPDVFRLERRHKVYVDGAAGGVGSYAVAIAKAVGCAVAASCRPAHADYVRGLGADLVVDYAAADVADQVKRWAPGGVDIVLDTQSGGGKRELLDLLAPGGLLVSLATLTNDADIIELTAAAEARGLRVHFLLLDYATLHQDMAGLTPLIESGRLRLPDVVRYPFDRAVEALEAMKAGGVRGKVVVEVAALD